MISAWRSLRRAPAFSVAAMLTLTLGIAAVGAMFAIVHGVLIAPLPYGEPDRLVSIGLQTAERAPMQQPPAAYFTYRQFATQLAEVGFYRTGHTNVWTEGVDDAPERVVATWMTASMVPMLQVPPLRGRSFTADEEQPGGPSAVLLSEAEWRTRFGASEEVLGRIMMVNSVPREIVGVMPARFAFPDTKTRVWLSARLPVDAVVGEFLYSGIGRLAPGATAAQAQHELAALLPMMAEQFPRLDSGGATATWLAETRLSPLVLPLQDAFTANIASLLWILAAVGALVLLVAWANVTNLMLIRADARQNEFAVRATLGAGRWHIARYLLGESLWLGAMSACLALLLVHIGLDALVAYGPEDIPRRSELGLSLTTTGFIVLISLVSTGLCAAVPALRLRPASLSSDLRDGARGDTAGKHRQHLRMGIVTLQIALAFVAALGSALLLRTAHRLNQVHPGFDASDVTIVWTLLPFARFDDAAAVAFYARLGE
jgi:predicted permease